MGEVFTRDEIAKEIIKNSIRSAICIDDLYAAPYSEDDPKLNIKDPKELFYTFRKHGHCDLDIYQFTDGKEWLNHKYLLHNKDLLIQDWELNANPGPGETKFDDTLPILEDVFKNSIIPFVVIYTNREDLSEVSKELLTNFNQYDNDDFEIIVSELEKKFERFSTKCDEITSFLEADEQIQVFHEYIMYPKKQGEIKTDILNSFVSFLEMNDPKLVNTTKKIKSGMNYSGGINSIEEAILLLCNICLSKNRDSGGFFTNVRIDIDRLCYSINGTIVLLLHKGDRDDAVKPADLFNVFSQSITNNPHSIINLISIELKDKFREDFSKIGTNFNTIDESAFLYHAKNYFQLNDETGETFFQEIPFKNFVVRSWIHELTQKNLDLDLKAFKLIPDEISTHSFKEGNELEISLAKYAAMVTCVKLDKRSNRKLGFGDIFKSGDHYFLCITPHCDCFTPDKIKNEFSFVKSIDDRPKFKSALTKAEQGFYSFVSKGSDVDAVEWTCKPFTTYIDDEMNESAKKSIDYAGETFELEFVCSLKENYAQRISNNSFGQGYRVGIDLPKLSS